MNLVKLEAIAKKSTDWAATILICVVLVKMVAWLSAATPKPNQPCIPAEYHDFRTETVGDRPLLLQKQ